MRRLVALVLTLVVSGAHAQMQMYSPGYGYNGAPMSSFLSSSFLIQKVVNDTSFKRGSDSGRAALGRRSIARQRNVVA